jgi:hypothetical protein
MGAEGFGTGAKNVPTISRATAYTSMYMAGCVLDTRHADMGFMIRADELDGMAPRSASRSGSGSQRRPRLMLNQETSANTASTIAIQRSMAPRPIRSSSRRGPPPRI